MRRPKRFILLGSFPDFYNYHRAFNGRDDGRPANGRGGRQYRGERFG